MNETAPTTVVRLTALAYGGEALGRLPDGRAVFVPFTLPGEEVRIRLIEERRGYARGELLEILTPAPERVAPRCLHFGDCGGCHYQHLPYSEQVRAKTEIVRDQLQRIGGFERPPVEPAVPSPEPFYYRNHVQFHLSPEGQLGYRAPRSDRVVVIQECHLPETGLNNLWPALDIEPLPGLTRVALRAGLDDDVLLVLESEAAELPEFHVDLPLSAVHQSPAGLTVLAGRSHVTVEVLGRRFRVSAGAFFQVNTALAATLVERLLAELPLEVGGQVLDVYSGVGLFSAFLAPRCGHLVAVEASPTACEDFEFNLAEFDHVELYEARAEEVLPNLDRHPDAVVVDPPRAGLGRRVVDALLSLAPARLAYVSCDPATLARDARRLVRGGYHLARVTPFDLFPQTYHIESLAIFEKTG